MSHPPSCDCSFCSPVLETLAQLHDMHAKLDQAKKGGDRIENAFVTEAQSHLKKSMRLLGEALASF